MDIISTATEESPRTISSRNAIIWQFIILIILFLAFLLSGSVGFMENEIEALLSRLSHTGGISALLFGLVGFINGFCIRPAAPKTALYNFFGSYLVLGSVLAHDLFLSGFQIITVSHACFCAFMFLLGMGMGLLASEVGTHLYQLRAGEGSADNFGNTR